MSHELPSRTTYYLQRLQAERGDQELWSRFYLRYAERFYAWCRKRGLPQADAEEVTQNVFERVFRRLETFDRARGSARAWLFTLIRSSLSDFFRDRPVERAGALDGAQWDAVASPEAGADLQRCFDWEHDAEVLLERLAERGFKAVTLESFRLVVLQGMTAEEAGVRLGIPAAHVQRYVYRVRTELRGEAMRDERS